MAEAAFNENSMSCNGFFCHMCGIETATVRDDFTCPTCFGGFIEEVELTHPSDDTGDSSDEDMDDYPSLDLLNQVGEILFGLGAERGVQVNSDRQLRGLSGLNFDNREERRRPWPNRNTTLPARQHNTVEHVIQDFILNLTGVGWGPMGHGARGNGPVFFLGNPGDYAWGREGLDAIVTQLLNQMDSAGPPPLDKEKINEIPVSLITQEQCDASLQCSVCWEDFKTGESVKKLQCEHVYHDPCIVPWLELHGTCPICRKSLTTGEEEKAGGAMPNHMWTRLSPLICPASTSSASNTSTSSAGTSPSSTSSSSTSSSASMRLSTDDNIDLSLE